MTYCVGIMLDNGLIFASDSRTHARVDNFARFCKMTVFERAGDRVFVLLSSGNLAGTQAVISVLKQRNANDGVPNLWGAKSMFDAAMRVSDAMRDVDRRDGQHLAANAVSFNASFIPCLSGCHRFALRHSLMHRDDSTRIQKITINL